MGLKEQVTKNKELVHRVANISLKKGTSRNMVTIKVHIVTAVFLKYRESEFRYRIGKMCCCNLGKISTNFLQFFRKFNFVNLAR